MASGGALTRGTRPERAQFTAAGLRAAVEEAHRHGLPITAHAHGTQAIRDAVAAGVDGIEHASFWSANGVDEPGELIALMAERRISVGALPMVGVLSISGLLLPPEVESRMPRATPTRATRHGPGRGIAHHHLRGSRGLRPGGPERSHRRRVRRRPAGRGGDPFTEPEAIHRVRAVYRDGRAVPGVGAHAA